jgi:enoyl-[acyl-carrier protein] reductase II
VRIETSVTRLLGIDVPILQAGMSWASSSSALPVAVSEAGGLGVIAAGPMRLPDLERTIDDVRAGTTRPFAVNVPLYRKGIEEVLDLLEAKRVGIIIASQGGPNRYLPRFKPLGTVCLHVVASPEHARKAADAGVDGLVVVGAEAGGHPPAEQVTTLVAVRAVARATSLPIVASGGFADGYGLAAALALGAGAANFGTRFLATPEASVHEAYKAAVVAAGVDGTRTVGRGLGMIRTLANAFTERMAELEARGAPVEERRDVFATGTLMMAALEGDVTRSKAEAGQSAGLIDDVVPAGELVRRIAAEYLEARRALPGASS